MSTCFSVPRLILGEEADLDYIAAANHGDTQAIKAQRSRSFRRLPDAASHTATSQSATRRWGFDPAVAAAVVQHLAGYRLAFGTLMSVLFLATMALGWRLQSFIFPLRQEQFSKYTALLLFCVGPTLMMRYDIVPALLTAAVVLALIERHALLATFFFALGVAAKLYPPCSCRLGWRCSSGSQKWRGGLRCAYWRCSGLSLLVIGAMAVKGAALPPLSPSGLPSASALPAGVDSGGLLALPRWPASLSSSFGSYNAQGAGDAALTVLGAADLHHRARRRRSGFCLGAAASTPVPLSRGQALCAWTLAALLCNLCVTKYSRRSI